MIGHKIILMYFLLKTELIKCMFRHQSFLFISCFNLPLPTQGARCSSMVRAFGHWIDPSWLSGPLPYVQCHITVNKTFPSFHASLFLYLCIFNFFFSLSYAVYLTYALIHTLHFVMYVSQFHPLFYLVC